MVAARFHGAAGAPLGLTAITLTLPVVRPPETGNTTKNGAVPSSLLIRGSINLGSIFASAPGGPAHRTNAAGT